MENSMKFVLTKLEKFFSAGIILVEAGKALVDLFNADEKD